MRTSFVCRSVGAAHLVGDLAWELTLCLGVPCSQETKVTRKKSLTKELAIVPGWWSYCKLPTSAPGPDTVAVVTPPPACCVLQGRCAR